MSSKTASILYTPFGIVGGILAGKLAKTLVDKAWGATRYDGAAPTPRDPTATIAQVILSGVVQGAAFTGSRALFERLAANAFQRWSGEWPSDVKPVKTKD